MRAHFLFSMLALAMVGFAQNRDRHPLDQGADWCPATVIPSVPFMDSGSTSGRTNDWNPSCGVCCGGEDVIYEFTPTATSVYRVSLCGPSTFDSVLEIRTDGACPGSALVGCNNNFCGARAQIDVLLSAGATYFVVIDGSSAADGEYTINVTRLGLGADNCPATVIAALPYTDFGTTLGRANNFSFCGATTSDVIYQFTAPVTANYVISLCGSTFNTKLALNTGGDCPGSTQVYCADDECGNQSLINTQLIGTLTYYIIVDGAPGGAGDYVLNVSQEPSCDSCEADSCPATIIPSLPYVDAGTTIGRANNFSTILCGGQNAPDVIYSLTLTSTQYIVAWLTNETQPFRHILALRSGSTCPGTNVECNFFGNYGQGASLTFQALAFQTYYLVIDNNSNHDGDYILHVNELCSVVQQPDDIVECAETPGINHLTTDCDGGCQNAAYGGVATFMNLVPGQTVFGKMFTYYRFQPRPDTDWFQFTLTQRCSIAVTVNAEFPWFGYLFPAGCGPTYYHFYTGPACTTATIIDSGSPIHVLPAGTYNLQFQAQQDTMIPTLLDYRLRIDNFVVCDAADSLTFKVLDASLTRVLDFYCPVAGNYQVWRSTDRNGVFPATFIQLVELVLSAGRNSWTDESFLQDYARFVIVQNCGTP